ncbi:hypothetical protein DFH01_03545 [Falsiroseomonas bella]|uniref:Methyltransferase FkbM domain-containing protein n=1 Tax=Falsiroseomonas bella TaxID=2184016 RepID=A0A317FH24_9PROT|nr:FkbM family methyltransferase [Falsiroseomonas bella]PWS38374.1 hypothetical protein DFH01_03545 [Falsiroseomonas bella]
MADDIPLKPGTQTRIHSLVPGGAPLELCAYYPRFADYYPEAELQTKRWFQRHVAPDWVIADVGANVGLYAMLFARLAPQGHVHAFEPTETARLLRANLAAAGAANVSVHDVALGAADGARDEAIYRIWGAAPETRTYPFSTLDSFVRRNGLDRLDCVKIDVDGFDLEVLKGARETLARFDPWLVVELNHALATRGQSVGEALLWLRAEGYTEALVLDQENFVLKRAGAAPAGEGVALRFDREPVMLAAAHAAAEPLPGFLAEQPVLHNGATWQDEVVVSPGPRWAYAAAWPVAAQGAAGPVMIEAELQVEAGAVGLGALTPDQSGYVGKEIAVSAAAGPQLARIFVPDGSAIGHFMLRNVTEDGGTARARLIGLRAAAARPAAPVVSAVLRHDVRAFALDQVLDPAAPERDGRSIPILPVQDIGSALGFPVPYIPERMVYRYGLEEFRTEIDEPGLYRYLYRWLRPKRHLEFGTWEGFGTVLCAESCEAEIWTVNLPEGERDAAGAPLYAAQRLPGETAAPQAGAAGDAGERIGWRYRAAGFAGRVHQLLMDSRDIPVAQFGPGFFDTVLVDGGHTPEVVAVDTDNALHLVRPGGAVIWHDFCPDPTALAASEAGRGVMRAWVEHHDRWRPKLRALYWLRPSWLLLGIRD